MRTPLRNSAPWIVAIATVVLCAAFWLPLGGERLNRTTYQALQGLVAPFGPPQLATGKKVDVAQAPSETSAHRDESLSAAAVRSAPDRRHVGRKKAISTKKAKPAQFTAAKHSPGPTVPEPLDAPRSTPSPIEGIPQPTSSAPPAIVSPDDYTADVIRDAFEGCDSKFPLDAKSSLGGVLVRLQGLCRWQGHFIVKVAVSNQSASDFFIKTLDVYDGAELTTIKPYFRLLVEPERTREGFVLFDARPGAQVKLALKEDRENGRSLQVSVRYPF